MTEARRKPAPEPPAESSADAPPTLAGPVDIRNVSLSVLTCLAVILMLQYMQPVLIPVALGILISYALWPIVTTLARLKIPRAIGAGVAVAVFVGTIGFSFYTFSDEAMGIIRDIPPAARTLRERAGSAEDEGVRNGVRAGPGSRD